MKYLQYYQSRGTNLNKLFNINLFILFIIFKKGEEKLFKLNFNKKTIIINLFIIIYLY